MNAFPATSVALYRTYMVLTNLGYGILVAFEAALTRAHTIAAIA